MALLANEETRIPSATLPDSGQEAGKEAPGGEKLNHYDQAIVPTPTIPVPFVGKDGPDIVGTDKPTVSTGSRLPVARSDVVSSVSPHPKTQDNPTFATGGNTPDPTSTGRKNVQFSPGTSAVDRAHRDESRSMNGESRPEPGAKSSSLYSKLKQLTTSTSSRQTDGPSHGVSADRQAADGSLTSRPETNEGYFAMTLEEDEDEDEANADADAEGDGDDESLDASSRRKRRRKSRRDDEVETAPVSPQQSRRMDFPSQPPLSDADPTRPKRITRRATDMDVARQGVSEDEGRLRAQGSPWRRKAPWRGMSYNTPKSRVGEGMLEDGSQAPNAGMSGPTDANGPDRPSRRRLMAQRGTTISAQKWRQIKSGLKLLGQKRKPKSVDHVKSAELLAELAAGGPAALMLASMFQRDEHGNKRIPVLLEQLKVSITDSESDPAREGSSGERHIIFRIELEYGNGVNRMRWVVRRSLRDFVNLHVKYKVFFQTEKLKRRVTDNKGMPHFPKRAFPFLKGSEGLEGDDDEDDENTGNTSEGATAENAVGVPKYRPGPGATGRRKSSTPGNFGLSRTGTGISGTGRVPSGALNKRDAYAEIQRKKLEVYLQKLIKFMLFRPDSNRLCKFLEMSALGVRLAAEGSYHGKEGFLVIQSAKGLDFRKALTPSNVKQRHRPKWFLVRHSYVVCVDSPEEMNIYDVFLFDAQFEIQPQKSRLRDHNRKELALAARESAKHPQHHRLKLINSERKLKLLARSERQLLQFETSIRAMVESSPWTKQNRFDSFAPVRPNCAAQWLVDGRDHMWVLARALEQAKDVIYIHDWWLSPEVYLRRPAAISQKWRLDRTLKRKAEQGVKIFVIVYRNIESAIPIDSQYTKFSLLDLHPNIFVQRSPNQFRQNTFFWAHHEKICVVDHTVAFVGGIDLCFGRWDNPQHVVTDDKPTGFEPSDLPKDADHCQLWPGKDYSNPRIQDFYSLNKPYEEMYDRTEVSRMPWHDISMQVVGQPARDLTRHFVQRWNYILRQRKPTRPTPFLLPPPDFNPADLEALGLDGTCEVQILRSAGPWSLGLHDRVEHSIMNAYVQLIEQSEHFVYIENQFFISSCQTEATTIENLIGDAIVERASRAHNNGEAWKAVIVIPLIPGFQNTVEQEGGTSVRLIMQYQYRSICRGDSSIFGKLRARGVSPEEYIQFYSLRQWGKIGPKKMLVTEQLYIHAKCMVVDDRIALIGSANINERSMLGSRDSECAAVVRDTDMIDSYMDGKPYKVGRFAHTLRMRLMQEHLGLDVDEIMEDQQVMEKVRRKAKAQEASSPGSADARPKGLAARASEAAQQSRKQDLQEELVDRHEKLASFNHDTDWEQANNPNLKSDRKITKDPRVTDTEEHRQDVNGDGFDQMSANQAYGAGRDSAITRDSKEVLIADFASEGLGTVESPSQSGCTPRMTSYVAEQEAPDPPLPPRQLLERNSSAQLGLPLLSQLPRLPDQDDTAIGGPGLEATNSKGSTASKHPLYNEIRRPAVDRDCMQDPVTDIFMWDTWHAVAENNTKIYRAVFRCMPDNEVKGWAEYKEYIKYEERFKQMQGNDAPHDGKAMHQGHSEQGASGPPGVGTQQLHSQLKGMVHLPGDTEKKTNGLKDTMRGVVATDKGKREEEDTEKEKMRTWAADANRAQMERQGRRLGRGEGSSWDEQTGAALETVPEDAHRSKSRPRTADGQTSDDSTTAVESPHLAPVDSEKATSHYIGYSDALSMNRAASQQKRRRASTRGSRREFTAADDLLSMAEAEDLLGLLQGHLICWPYDWLENVERGSNWLFPMDTITPIEIYV